MARTQGRGQFTTIQFTAADVSGVVPKPVMKKLSDKFSSLENYFQTQVQAVTQNLATSGVNITRKVIRESKTQWGASRIAGEHFGVRFAPYGRTDGREDTGFMYDSVSSSVVSSRGRTVGTYGWSPSVIASNPYILFQAFGFFSTTRFDPAATAATGRAKFSDGNPPKFIQGFGFGPRTGAGLSIEKRLQSAYSAAWNESVKQFNSGGFRGNPGSYLQNRKRTGASRA